MTILRPRIWYVCNKCYDWFYYLTQVPIMCPDCKEGKLIKTCAFCGNDLKKCSCSKEILNSKCHTCGLKKDECKCIN